MVQSLHTLVHFSAKRSALTFVVFREEVLLNVKTKKFIAINYDLNTERKREKTFRTGWRVGPTKQKIAHFEENLQIRPFYVNTEKEGRRKRTALRKKARWHKSCQKLILKVI